MARKQQGNYIQVIDVQAGDVDQDTSAATLAGVSAHVPTDGAVLQNVRFIQRVAGVGTGTIAAFIKAGTQTVSSTIAAIDADAAAEVVHGQVDGQKPATVLTSSDILKVTTVKTGTVSTGATLSITLLWKV